MRKVLGNINYVACGEPTSDRLYEILKEKNILGESKIYNCSNSKVNCLYHKILHSLRYVNQVVIDISNNSILSLFWLGIAHGSSVNAVTILHDATEKEREKMTGSKEKKYRSIFDVAGLWTAILHSNDTQGFYKQLAQAQYGIVNHEKLMLKTKNVYEKKLHDKWQEIGKEFKKNDIEEIYSQEKKEIIRQMESYYRSRFWNTMLRHNQLLICMPQIEYSENLTEEPRGYTSKWDFKASALLSHYLSKRTVISEYTIEAISGKEPVDNIQHMNFISLGSEAKPLGKTLSQHISENEKYKKNIHNHYSKPYPCLGVESDKEARIYKGFKKDFLESNIKIDGYYTQHPQFICSKVCCNNVPSSNVNGDKIFYNSSELENSICYLCGKSEHIEIAQLILWRESSYNFHEKTVFQVAVNGSSGPATLGLASLFVGDDQKEDLFGKKEKNLLYDLDKAKI